jgi:predicted flavoprotein YhiN
MPFDLFHQVLNIDGITGGFNFQVKSFATAISPYLKAFINIFR